MLYGVDSMTVSKMFQNRKVYQKFGKQDKSKRKMRAEKKIEAQSVICLVIVFIILNNLSNRRDEFKCARHHIWISGASAESRMQKPDCYP